MQRHQPEPEPEEEPQIEEYPQRMTQLYWERIVSKMLSQPESEMSLELYDYAQDKQGGIDFVKAIFQNMGGTIMPPHRPNKGEFTWDIHFDNYMMDFEN